MTFFVLNLLAVRAHAAAAAEAATSQAEGRAVFERACAVCHVAGPAAAQAAESPAAALQARAVPLEQLREFTPEAILNALTQGKMQAQGALLSAAERRAVSEFASGATLGASLGSAAAAAANRCTEQGPLPDPAQAPSWNGWGNGVRNTRFQPYAEGGLTAADLPRLKLKWAFGYAGVSAARAQPAVVGDRLFAASENGEVHALNAKSGCSYWTFKAQAAVRTALSVAPYDAGAGRQGLAVYFGDGQANAYALDARTGEQIWVRKVDEHPAASITGAPTVHEGRVYVPVQGLREEARGGLENYACCTFRGSLVALDAATGKMIWKTYVIEESRPRGKNAAGVTMYGPAGGGIWSAPTVDPRRRRVYVATGNGYADPAQPTTDAVIAMDLDTGAIEWVRQATPADSWTMGCKPENPDNPACPAVLGPDYDFAASPALARTGDRELLVVPQKSGIAYALDPDTGEIVWQYRFGRGSGLGGQWGGAVDGERAYFGVADLLTDTPGGMRAVELATGREIWSQPPQKKLCAEGRGCSAGQGGALTAIPGAVLNAGLDGGIRAYASESGEILWLFDANREFQTVNGVPARGGSMDGPGPVVVDGMLYVNSGYGGLIGVPGNVLLAFGLE